MKRLKINMDELAFVLHRGAELEMKCYLDLKSGRILNFPTNLEVVKQLFHLKEDVNNIDINKLIRRILPEPQHFLELPDMFDQVAFDLMSRFTRSIEVSKPLLAEELWKGIHEGQGYKAFNTKIREEYPGLLRSFIRLRDELFEESARNWLKSQHIEPQPQTDGSKNSKGM